MVYAFDGLQVLETDTNRLATNDTKPTLYKIKIDTTKSPIWMEGADRGYGWLTIISSDSVRALSRDYAKDWRPVKRKDKKAHEKVFDHLVGVGDIDRLAQDLKKRKSWITVLYGSRWGEKTLILRSDLEDEAEIIGFLEGKTGLACSKLRDGEPEKSSTDLEPGNE